MAKRQRGLHANATRLDLDRVTIKGLSREVGLPGILAEDNGKADAGNTNEKDTGCWEGKAPRGKPIHQRDAGCLFDLMNEATRKLKWQLRNIISSAVKRVSRNRARGSARFIPARSAQD